MCQNYIKCDECGQFCKPHDSGNLYGGYYDEEPPDPEYFCKKCVDKKLKTPEQVVIGCWWIKPGFVSILKSIRRHSRKHPSS